MPTVIDSLIVELGLDPTKFTEGQKKAADALHKMEDAAGKSGKVVTKHTEDMSDAFSILQGRLLGIAALFTGGLGIEKFTRYITDLTAKTGYLAKSLGISTRELGAWEGAGASVGASAGEIAGGVSSIQSQLAQQQLYGNSRLAAFAYATHQQGQGPGVELVNPRTGKNNSPTEILMELSRWAAAQPDKNVASQALRDQAGLSQGMVNLLLLGPKELQRRLTEYSKLAPTDDQVKKLQQLQTDFAKVTTKAEALGRALVTYFEPALDKILKLIDLIEGSPTGKPADQASPGAAFNKKLRDAAKENKPPPKPEGFSTLGQAWDSIKRWWNGDKNVVSPPKIQDSPPSQPGTPPSNTAPSHVGRTGWWTPARKQHAVDYLMKNAGLPEIGARALVARWAGVESTARGASSVNPIGAQGIAQWLGNRQHGYRLGDFDSQLAHAVQELKTTEHRAYNTLKTARTPMQAAVGASQFERAEGYNGYADAYVGKTLRALRNIPGESIDLAKKATADSIMLQKHAANADFTTALASIGKSNVTHSNQTSINNLNVHTQATDAQGIGSSIQDELSRFNTVVQANTGLQ